MQYKTLEVGPIGTGCYVLWDEDTKTGAIVDPGAEPDAIRKAVDGAGVDVKYILLTHGHFDHAFYARPLADHYNAKIVMHEADIPMLTMSLIIAEPFYDPSEFMEFQPDIRVSDGDEVPVGVLQIRVLHTPGHSAGGVCYATDAGVFCGDTIFSGSIGRTDLLQGDYDQLITSIRTKILVLDDAVRLFPGHGPSTTVGVERRTNPFLT